MAKRDEKMRLGFDLTDTQRGEQVLIEIFNKINKGIQAIALESVNLTKKGQLISASFKAITSDGKQVEAQLKKTTDALLAFTKTGELRTATGNFASASKSFAITGISGLSGGTQFGNYEKAYREMTVTLARRQQQFYKDWQAAIRENDAFERRTRDQALKDYLKAEETKRKYSLQLQKVQRQALMQDWSAAIREDRERSAPSRMDKLFNQASAIASGIVISQVFMNITGAMQESINTATKFQIKISEIRTLSQDGQLTTGQWASEIRGLSDAFGVDILDVTAGLYETISNQIAKGAEATSFMAEAMRFAAVSVTSTENSVNLLSSAINAYGLTTSETNQIAASMFTLIDLGRVRADELANSIGTVYAISSKLGVSYNEVNAALSVMTIQGVKANNAMTYLRNLFVSLMKPSDALKESFKSWGVSSGQAAIQTFGFVGVLKKLDDIVAKGGLEELSDDLKNIRSILAGALLTGNDAVSYEETLKKFEKANRTYANATKIAFESSGKYVTQEFNKVKNLFVEGFGTKVIDSVAGVTRQLGGLANMIEVVSKVLITGSAAWGMYRLSMISTASTSAFAISTMTKLASAITFISTPIGAAVSILGIVTYEVFNTKNSFEALQEQIKKTGMEMAEANNSIKLKYQNMGETLKKSLDTSYQPVFKKIAETRVKLTDMAEHIRDNYQEVSESIKDLTDTYMDKLTERISEIKSEVKQLEQIAKESEKYSRSFVKKRNDNMFEDSIEDLTSAQKAGAEYERSQSRFTSAKQLFEEAKKLMSAGSVEAANEAFKDARAMLEEALTLADRAQKNNIKGKKEYAKALDEVTKDLEQAQKKRARIAESLDDTKKFSKATPRNIDKVKDLREEYKAIQKEIADLEARKEKLSGGDSATTISISTAMKEQETEILKRQRQIEEQILAAEREMQEIVKKRAVDREKEVKALEASKKAIKDAFTEAIKLDFKDKDTPEQKAKKLEQFRKLQTTVTQGLAETGVNFGQELEIIRQLAEKEKVLRAELEVKKQIKDTDEDRAKIEKEREAQAKRIETLAGKSTSSVDSFNKQVTTVVAAIQTMKDTAPWTLGAEQRASDNKILTQLTEVSKRLQSENIKVRAQALIDAAKLLDAAQKQFKSDDTSFTGAKRQNVSEQALQAAITAKQGMGEYERLNNIQKELETLKISYSDLFKSIESTIEKSLTTQANLIKEAAVKINASNRLIAPTTPKADFPGMAFGGAARGLDTIPAMLSAGEFVVNAGATRRFYSQLVAMNSGGVRHMAQGGYVSNNSFGDINVTVAGGKSSTTTARDIGLALRRELRRGTLPPL